MEYFAACRLVFVVFLAQFLLQGHVFAIRTIQFPSQRGAAANDEKVLTSRPLIGILSQPGDGDGHLIIDSLVEDRADSNISYIAASYVKFVEAGGARAVPIIYNEPEEILRQKFDAVNGLLFPGGDASLQDGPFYRTAQKLFKWALEANDNGDFFPVYGVCLGYELLAVLVTENHNVLEHFQAHKNPGPLFFVDEPAKEKSYFKWLPSDLIEKVTSQHLTLENHQWGLSPETFAALDSLSGFFEVLTVTPDENGKIYVSTVQGRKYPVTAVQYHPEKNVFEWGYDTIPHSSSASQLTQAVANYFISEARKSSHSPASLEQEQKFLIYNTVPVYSGKDGKGFFDQSYVFF